MKLPAPEELAQQIRDSRLRGEGEGSQDFLTFAIRAAYLAIAKALRGESEEYDAALEKGFDEIKMICRDEYGALADLLEQAAKGEEKP